ncbi:hypothetical protein RHMOL_Rhmol13G0131000 [Rhododendron molle]|uniref:Uncharacterized protein n=1 Tax=Rhododendron molle TaxID=49168 RepID=A0ACC0L6B9_RHOML|nr:hypothetical protein RHMOL_Rhmol13G0131000 [Rhododendron molle]
MQSNWPSPLALSPFASTGVLSGDGGFDGTRALLFTSLIFFQGGGGGGMDLSKFGEKILTSVRSARSLGLLPPTSDRPEVPARAVAAAAVARALAGLPPHQRHNLSSSSEEFHIRHNSLGHAKHGSQDSDLDFQVPNGEVVDSPRNHTLGLTRFSSSIHFSGICISGKLCPGDFDPVRHVLEHIPSEENDLAYLEEKATLRLAQLDRIQERLSRHVMEHHEEMVKGMHLVRELEKDLKVANVICMNGRRHLISSRNEVSRDLVVTTSSKKKQVLLDMIPVLTELLHALDMQVMLENHVEEGNFSKAFQVLSEYLQILDSLSELSSIQEMSRGVEVWLGKTLQKLDSLLLGVCQDFKEEGYMTVVDAYALIGDVSGLAEKIQSFFMQEVLSETHSVLKNLLQGDLETSNMQSSRLTYSDLCHRIPESKFRQCLLTTLAVVFKLLSSYYAIMSFQPDCKVSSCHTPQIKQKQDDIPGGIQHVDSANGSSCGPNADDVSLSESMHRVDMTATASSADATETDGSMCTKAPDSIDESRNGGSDASSSGSPWFQLRKDATVFVSQTLHRGRKNLWQLTTSRVSVLLSSAAVCSTSIHQFLRNYEDLNIFILAGEAFCGSEAALKMVLEKENWLQLPPETIQVVSFAGLVGDGAALIVPSDRNSPNKRVLRSSEPADLVETDSKKSGFSYWLKSGNPFLVKLSAKEHNDSFSPKGSVSGEPNGIHNENLHTCTFLPKNNDAIHGNGTTTVSEDENEDLHADFIDEDSQLPSRISKSNHSRNYSAHSNGEEGIAQTGSSLCLLRLMDKYARLMQKLEIVNVEFFRGICQLFGIFFHFVFEAFGQHNSFSSGKGLTDLLSCIVYEGTNAPKYEMGTDFVSDKRAMAIIGIEERCAGADTISLVARLLHRSKVNLQSMLLQNNGAVVEDFYAHMVDSVPDLAQHIHRTTARLLLHINGYVDRIANAKWEVKELGLEHNGYVDLLLGEFKHYKTRLAHGGIQKEVQDLLLEYGLEIVAETLIEGLSRVRRCSDEGRALMSLDLQAYYLPETEYVHWARKHPEYTKTQIIGLINLVATMKGWKRKTRLEVLEKIEGAGV